MMASFSNKTKDKEIDPVMSVEVSQINISLSLWTYDIWKE